MSMNLLDQTAPPEPMAALNHIVISPANIALEARLSRMKPLGRFGLWKAGWRLRWLMWQLRRLGREALERSEQELASELKTLLDYKRELEAKREAAPDDPHLAEMYRELRAELTPKHEAYKSLRIHLAESEDLAREYKELKQRIDDNPKVIQRAAIEAEKMKIQRQECRSYEQLIIDRWTQLGYCYRQTDGKGNKRVDKVGFSVRYITPDAIFLKVGVARRHWTGGYTTQLPYGVRIADLLKPETLDDLSYACQRQVSAKSDYLSGAWIIVNRLDTTDGLLNEVAYADVMQRYPVKYHNRIPMCVGVAERKQVQWLNLTDYPHGLIAGFTGSGKSNLINATICTFITRHDPKDLRLILVDLKEGVEFSIFAGIPHLEGKIIDKVSELANRLEELEAIMQIRYETIRGKSKNLADWNAKHPSEYMARIIVFIDEVVSTMDQGDYTKRIVNSLKQLTAKGRAAGIHIIMSTQRPSVDAIPGTVKVNLSFRIVGRMPSHVDSLTVLGSGAAKELPDVHGRMVMQLGPDPVAVQTPLITIEDIEAALKAAMQYEKPEPIPVPENAYTQTEWTPERIIALSLHHLGGNISHTVIWEEVKEEGSLTKSQNRELCERIWSMDCIPFEGKQYKVEKGKGRVRKLVEIESQDSEPSELLNFDMSPV